MTDRYFEDFSIGDTFESGTVFVSKSDIVDFALAFDPQPWHLDTAEAEKSSFRGLVASGWHTTAITMRLFVESGFLRATGILGLGVDNLRWPKAVRPETTLRVRGEVKALEPPAHGRHAGTMRVQLTALDQNDEPVLTEVAILRVRVRPHGSTC